jgi:hypothetical protein
MARLLRKKVVQAIISHAPAKESVKTHGAPFQVGEKPKDVAKNIDIKKKQIKEDAFVK